MTASAQERWQSFCQLAQGIDDGVGHLLGAHGRGIVASRLEIIGYALAPGDHSGYSIFHAPGSLSAGSDRWLTLEP